MMYNEDWPRKRGREDEDSLAGFSEHRVKRHIATLPHRTSPNSRRCIASSFDACSTANYTSTPAPPTITPADSDGEEAPKTAELKSVWSPWGSSPVKTPTQSYDVSPMNSSESTQMSDVAIYSDDFEMADPMTLSPGPFHNDPATTISSRVPTPIHSSFSHSIHAEKGYCGDFADDEAVVDRLRRGRRLPSPISEGELSPSSITDGLGVMQMEIESPSPISPDRETPTKKGHYRSKHSLRAWTGGSGEAMPGMKRTFSMGYRADCEKCRLKIPGHYSHIITYE
ncbi:hypothetical protein B7494_g1116 [Chlorociboria aeruginascens]|nr:hypothetical protein B7494_g1116 [Chlorociboria aeruginascens]